MKATRILLVGSDKVWSLERIFLKHLCNLGVEAQLFASQNLFYDFYEKNLINKILFRTGISSIYKTINEELLKKVNEFQPDLIWVFKGMEVLPETLKNLKSRGIGLANYNPDNPFFFSGRGSGNKNVKDSIGLFHVHFTYDRDIRKTIQNEFGLPCYILPFGFELSEALYQQCKNQDEILKICFIGNPDKGRVEFLEKLADQLPLDVYGHDWEKHTQHQNISIHGPVYGDDFWKTLYRYRAQLNLLRPHNPASHNMRSFEIPGVGGIGLFPDTIDHREYFGSTGIAFLYHNMSECIVKAEEIFQMSRKDISEWRNNARNLSLQKGFDYLSRTKQFLASLNEIDA